MEKALLRLVIGQNIVMFISILALLGAGAWYFLKEDQPTPTADQNKETMVAEAEAKARAN